MSKSGNALFFWGSTLGIWLLRLSPQEYRVSVRDWENLSILSHSYEVCGCLPEKDDLPLGDYALKENSLWSSRDCQLQITHSSSGRAKSSFPLHSWICREWTCSGLVRAAISCLDLRLQFLIQKRNKLPFRKWN